MAVQRLSVREFVDGKTLGKLVFANSIGLFTAVRMVRDVANAIARVHRQGTIHRSLEPSNVLVDKSSNIKLIGFGKARAMDDAPLLGDGETASVSVVRALNKMLIWLCEAIQHPILNPRSAVEDESHATAAKFADALTAWLEQKRGA
jgi:serine/threonine protein kinase